jgi:hypothetical protein
MNRRIRNLQPSRLMRPPYFLTVLDQLFLSAASTVVSISAFLFLQGNDLANFISCWVLLWGLVAILSETLVNPLRVKFNKSLDSKPARLQIERIRTGFIYLGTSLILVSLVDVRSQLVSSIAASISLALAATAYSLRRNSRIDLNEQRQNTFEAAVLLVVSISILGFWLFFESFYSVEALISLSLAYCLLQIKNLMSIKLVFFYLGDSVRVIVKNLKFGLSTVMRILLYSVAIVAIVRSNYSQDEFVGYGLILSLSNPGIILSSIVAQLGFRRMSKLQNSMELRLEVRNYFFRVIYFALLGTVISVTLASVLSIYSENYKSTIEFIGWFKVIVYGFLCIFFIGFSSILSSAVQILNKGNLQIIAILFGGLVGMFLTYFLNPMIGAFAPYAAYVIFISILILIPWKEEEYDLDNLHR